MRQGSWLGSQPVQGITLQRGTLRVKLKRATHRSPMTLGYTRYSSVYRHRLWLDAVEKSRTDKIRTEPAGTGLAVCLVGTCRCSRDPTD
jgi:hypothetical protein